ncbi:MAG: hypothetical protein AAF968_06765, partial [Pseudomonadota bacterium]
MTADDIATLISYAQYLNLDDLNDSSSALYMAIGSVVGVDNVEAATQNIEMVMGLSAAGLDSDQILEAMQGYQSLSSDDQAAALETMSGYTQDTSTDPPTLSTTSEAQSLAYTLCLDGSDASLDDVTGLGDSVINQGGELDEDDVEAMLAVYNTVGEDGLFALYSQGVIDQNDYALIEAVGTAGEQGCDAASIADGINAAGIDVCYVGTTVNSDGMTSFLNGEDLDSNTTALAGSSLGSLDSDTLAAAVEMGTITQDQADEINIFNALHEDGGMSYADAQDLVCFIESDMSADDVSTIANTLLVDGDDKDDMLAFLTSIDPDNPRDASSLLTDYDYTTDFDDMAEAATHYSADEIQALVGNGLTQEQANRLIVASALLAAGTDPDDLDTAMATYDDMSDADQAYVVEQCSDRGVSGTDCFADVGYPPDYTQASLTYESDSVSDEVTAISTFLVDGGSDSTSVSDYVDSALAFDENSNIDESEVDMPDSAMTEEEMTAYLETSVSDWDDLDETEQSMILDYMMAVQDPDNSFDDDGNVVDEDGDVVAVAITPDTLAAAGLSDDAITDVATTMTVSMLGRMTLAEGQVEEYADAVDEDNTLAGCASEGYDEIDEALEDLDDDDTVDLSTIYVTDPDDTTQTISLLEFCNNEGISVDGSDPSAMTADDMAELQTELSTYEDDKLTD